MHLSCGLLGLIAALAVAGNADPGFYRDEANRFQVAIPPGWREMTGDELEKAGGRFKGRLFNGAAVSTIAGFCPKVGQKGNPAVTIVSCDEDWSPLTNRAAVERKMAEWSGLPVVQAAGDFTVAVRRAGGSSAVMDWERKRLIFTATSGEAPVPRDFTVSSYRLTDDGAIGILCHSTPETFENDREAFGTLADSFALDPDGELDLAEFDDPAFAAGVAVGALVCVGVPALLIVVLVRGNSRSASRQRGSDDRSRRADGD